MEKHLTHYFHPFPVLLLLSGLLLTHFREAPEPVAEVATHSAPPCNCTLTQGNFTSPLPFLSSNTSAVNFYQYGNPSAASANTGLEVSETLLLMMYEDLTTGNTSLIIILDQVNDGTGGNADITVNCLPNSAFVDLSDDPGELTGGPPVITGNFNWQSCCTDGGVISGVGCGNTITINPTINSGINFFSLVYGTPSNPIYVNMPQINCPITINCGGTSCCTEAFEFSAITQNATCTNSGDGTIDLSTNCAAAPFFQWSNGAFTEDVFGLNPGVYSVTITDANGCSQSASYIIAANNPDPQPSIIGPTEFCTGGIVQLSVGGVYSSYLWSTGSPSSAILVTSPGTYSVTVTNTFGCSGTVSTTLTENPSPVPEITGPTSICLDDTITLDAGPGFLTYLWSSGDFTQTIDISQFGGYFVTVTNSFGCSGFDFAIIEPLPSPVPMITGPNSFCSGGLITLDAGAGFDSYLWSTGASTQSITTSMGGTFFVTVTDSSNCEGIDTLEVTEYPSDSILLFQTSCNPADTGIFFQQFINQVGCDSLVFTTVTFLLSDTTELSQNTCDPNETGQFEDLFVNQNGCDSLVLTTVALLPSDTIYLSENTCDPNETGEFEDLFANQNGCDSLVLTTVTLLPSDTVFLSGGTCDPTAAGEFEDLFVNQYGCDSLVVTSVSLLTSDTVQLESNTCDPNEAGEFEDHFLNQFGCDSLVLTTVSLSPSDTVYLSENTCNPNEAGEFEDLFVNRFGCDSLVFKTVGLLPSDTTDLFLTSCDPNDVGVFESVFSNQFGCDSLVVTTVAFSQADTTAFFQSSCDPADVGTFEELLTNQFGCDSLIITTIDLLPSNEIFLNETTCEPDEAGVFEENLINQFGCDSLVITTVSLLPSDEVFLNETTCQPDLAGVFEEVFVNQFGCDSLVLKTVFLLPSDEIFLTQTTCDPAQAGEFEENLVNQFGCDSTVILTVNLLPSDTTDLFLTSCDPNDVGVFKSVFPNQFGCDSLIVTTVTFSAADTTALFQSSCDPGEVGVFEEILTNQFGCDSLIITTIDLLPSDEVFLTETTCDPNAAGVFEEAFVNQFGCDSVVLKTVELLPSDEIFLTQTTCDPDEAGVFEFILTNQYGCDSVVFLTVDLLPSDEVFLTETTCDPDEAGVFQSTLTNQYGCDSVVILTVDLLPSDEVFLTETTCDPDEAGVFQSTFQNQYGCDSLVILTVELLPSPEVTLESLTDYNGFGTSCAGASDGEISVNAVGGSEPFLFQWSNGATTAQLSDLPAGNYALTVTNGAGCSTSLEVTLEEPPPLELAFSVGHPDCFDQTEGAIVAVAEGGVEPYEFSLNGEAFQTSPEFAGLDGGTFELTLRDANDCAVSEIILIDAPIQLEVDLGEDLTIELGENTVLQALVNVPYDSLASVVWEPLDSVECPECLTQTVAPIITTSYSVSILADNGCGDEDELTVSVERHSRIYAPNVFSPNGDGNNDVFMLFAGPEVLKINTLQVFSRWGEKVFDVRDVLPNDSSSGWDGTYRGEPLNPAVFVFWAEVELIDGSLVTINGDVAVVR